MADPDRSVLEDARKRARRRLVGSIVLALGAAVVLPIFLETDPKPLGPDVQLQIPPIDDGKFQNRLTPEPKGGNKDTRGEVRMAPSSTPTSTPAATPASSSAVAAPAPVSAPSPATAPSASPTERAAAPAPEQTQPAPAPTAASKAAPNPAAPTAPSSVQPAQPTSSPTTAKGNPNGAFVVQLGAFVGLPVAVELADKARDQGYPVFLEKVTTTNGPVHRVRVGPYSTQPQAHADAVKLKLAGFTADVRKR